MNRSHAAIALVVIVAIFAGYLLGRSSSGVRGPASDDDEAPDRSVLLEGERAIRLTQEDQRRGGIELIEPQRALFNSEATAIGEVMDLQPLLELRTLLAAGQAERAAARAIAQNAEQTLRRLRALHEEDGNISTRQLQAAQVAHEAARHRYRALEIGSEDLHASAVHEWGPVLVAWALAESSAEFARILANEEVVLLVTITGAASLPGDVNVVFVYREHDRAHAREAFLISASPRASPQVPGETWFFRTVADRLRVGTRVHVWVPGSGQDEVGVRLPSSAVIWHAGRSWIYLNRQPELFVRYPVDDPRPLEDGWFTADASLEEARIVGVGAQTLLSEEFRRQIPDEDDDP